MTVFRDIASSFLKIGVLGFGGGYAMLPLIQNEVVVRRAWINDAGFSDMLAVSQLTPGPIAVNAATYLGYSGAASAATAMPPLVAGLLGAFLATLCVCLPPFVLSYAASRLFNRLRGHPRLRQVMADLRPVVIGLIAAAAGMLLLEPATFAGGWLAALIFAAVLTVSLATRCHPAWLLLAAALAGIFNA